MLSVSDLMTLNPRTVSPDTTLNIVKSLLSEEGCRQLPVVEDGRLVGIITDRDVRTVSHSPLEKGRDADITMITTVAAGVMTERPLTVTPHTSAVHAANLLSVFKYGALPVVANESSLELVGIISVTDFLDFFKENAAIFTADNLQ